MSNIFHTILFEPIFNLLVFIYTVIPGQDFGLAIIVLTLLIRLIFVPLSIKTLRSQRALTQLQPELKALQAKHKTDRAALSRATMELYRQRNVNPFSGCLPLLIQIPILFALYQAFQSGLDPKNLNTLYPFITNPGVIHEVALGFIKLGQPAYWLAITAGVLQAGQAWLASKNTAAKPGVAADPASQALSKQMLYFFPVLVIIISWKLPAGLVIYWVASTLFSIGEQLYINKKYT